MGLQATLQNWLGFEKLLESARAEAVDATKKLYYYNGTDFAPVLQLPSEGGIDASAPQVQNIDTVFACLRAIAEPIATLDMQTVKVQGEVKEQVTNHVTKLIEYPNGYQTQSNWLERTLWHMAGWGESFSYIFRDSNAMPTELRLIHPRFISDYRFDEATGTVWWKIDPGDTEREPGVPTGFIPHWDLLHFPILNEGTVRGRSVLTAYRNDFSTAIASRKYGNEFFEKDGTPSTWIETYEQSITPEQNKDFIEQMRTRRRGSMMMPYGRKVHPISISHSDSQFLESRVFSVEQICRIFNVPPPMVQNYKDGAQYSNLETLLRSFAGNTLAPYTTKISKEMTWKLFTRGEQDRGNMIDFDFSSLLKADPKTRAEVAGKYIQNGIRTPNEIRATDGYSPQPNGDRLLVQQNMAFLDDLDSLYLNKYGNNSNQPGDPNAGVTGDTTGGSDDTE